MSAEALGKVLRYSEAKSTALLVLLAIADYYNDDEGYAWPSIETLARIGRCSPRAVYRALKKLEELGELKVESGGGRHETNHYVIGNFKNKTDLKPSKRDRKNGDKLAKNGDKPEPPVAKNGDKPEPPVAPYTLGTLKDTLGGEETPPPSSGSDPAPHVSTEAEVDEALAWARGEKLMTPGCGQLEIKAWINSLRDEWQVVETWTPAEEHKLFGALKYFSELDAKSQTMIRAFMTMQQMRDPKRWCYTQRDFFAEEIGTVAAQALSWWRDGGEKKWQKRNSAPKKNEEAEKPAAVAMDAEFVDYLKDTEKFVDNKTALEVWDSGSELDAYGAWALEALKNGKLK